MVYNSIMVMKGLGTMRAAVLAGIRRIRVVDLPVPRPGRGQVLVRVRAVGICRSDVHYYRTGRIGNQVIRRWPQLLGHEAAGEVAFAGPDVNGFRPGDRVAIEPATPCGKCRWCRAGRGNICPRVGFLGMPGQPGALAEYLVMPARNLEHLPAGISFEEGVALEPMAIGLHAVALTSRMPREAAVIGPSTRWPGGHRVLNANARDAHSRMRSGDRTGQLRIHGEVVVIGAGPVGLAVLAALRLRRARVTMLDYLASRLKVARRMGAARMISVRKDAPAASAATGKYSLVFEAGGTPDALELALELAAPGGTVGLIGIQEGNRTAVNLHLARRKELALLNVRRSNGETRDAIKMMAAGKLDLRPMVTHRAPLGETARIFRMVDGYRDGVVKAVILP